jgi:uncharacterized ion transporter superfamily protein YfcC
LSIAYAKEGVRSRDPVAVAREYLHLREQHPLLVGLTHLGFRTDNRLAETLGTFDVIVGGHSHTLVDPAVIVNGVLIAQAAGTASGTPVSPDRPKYLGQVVVVLENDQVIEKRGQVFTFSAPARRRGRMMGTGQPENSPMGFRIRMPHTLVLMFAMMVLALVLTWVLPAGRFETVTNDSGGTLVVPGTFQRVPDPPRLWPWALLLALPRAMADAQNVIFFVFLISGVIAILQKTGAIDAMIGCVLQRFRDRWQLLILAAMSLFAVFSASFGMSVEYLAFVGVLVAVGSAIGLDRIAIVGIVVVGYGVGYGCALFNPFTVQIAQRVAELPPGSGMGYRAILAGPFFLIGFHHVYRYAQRTMADPASSLMAGIANPQTHRPEEYPELRPRHVLVLLAAGMTLAALIAGIVWLDWYLTELGALFLALGLVAAAIARLSPNDTAQAFHRRRDPNDRHRFADRLCALDRVDSGRWHGAAHHHPGLATPLSLVPAAVSAVGMLLIQSLLNFFIPSGSGQAYATMPIMAPIGDLLGIQRQVTVLAYQFGDGFTNMIIPTNAVLMGILGLAGIPYARWFRFILPLILKLTAASAVALIVAVWIGYQ